MMFQKTINQVSNMKHERLTWFILLFFYWLPTEKKESSPSRSSENSDSGHWTELVRRRGTRLNELRREFRGWHGTHEQHCILHDVLLQWHAADRWNGPGRNMYTYRRLINSNILWIKYKWNAFARHHSWLSEFFNASTSEWPIAVISPWRCTLDFMRKWNIKDTIPSYMPFSMN